jgi:hypothetical protein
LTFIDVLLTRSQRVCFATVDRGISRHVKQEGEDGRNAGLFWG